MGFFYLSSHHISTTYFCSTSSISHLYFLPFSPLVPPLSHLRPFLAQAEIWVGQKISMSFLEPLFPILFLLSQFQSYFILFILKVQLNPPLLFNSAQVWVGYRLSMQFFEPLCNVHPSPTQGWISLHPFTCTSVYPSVHMFPPRSLRPKSGSFRPVISLRRPKSTLSDQKSLL